MINDTCLLVETENPLGHTFLTGERPPGLFNDQAFCTYLCRQLKQVGISVPFCCREEKGWWLELQRGRFWMGLHVHADIGPDGRVKRYALIPALRKSRVWSMSRFRMIDVGDDVTTVIAEVQKALESDCRVSRVERLDRIPFAATASSCPAM